MSDRFDDAALLALGVLPPAQARETAAALRGDAAAANEYRELRAAADAVGLAADEAANAPSAVASARMRAAILSQIRQAGANVEAPPPIRPNGAVSGVIPLRAPAATARPKRSASEYYLGAAAAAAILIAVFTGIDDLRQRSEIADAVASAHSAAADAARAHLAAVDAERAVAVVSDARARRFPIALGSVVAAREGIVLDLDRLPALPPGKVYQAWTLQRGGKSMSPSVTFSPSAAGETVIAVPIDGSRVAAVAVSVEPLGGSLAPTSTPTFVRTLS